MLPIILATINDPGKKDFYTSLYREYYPLMKYRAIKLTNDQSMVEDVVQDTLVRLLKHYDHLRILDEDRLAGYIVLTVKSAACNALRKKGRETKFLSYEEWEAVPAPEADSPELAFLKGEDRENRIRAMKRLPEAQRDLLLYKHVLEMPTSELAILYNTSVDNVWQMLSRARRRLCKLLEELL